MSRVFVVGVGRCGTHTFAKAIKRGVTSHACEHESRTHLIAGRLDYPENHVEVDHRLAFFLDKLKERYPTAYFIHLERDWDAVIASWARRFHIRGGVMRTWANLIAFRPRGEELSELDKRLVAESYVKRTRELIDSWFYSNGDASGMIETVADWFPAVWNEVPFAGDPQVTLDALQERHGAS